jgi:aminopeptidase-like protein
VEPRGRLDRRAGRRARRRSPRLQPARPRVQRPGARAAAARGAQEHLAAPEQPDWIPFRNSYYNRNWGFCLQHRRLESLAEGEYEACIESTLEDRSLTYGEAFVPESRGRGARLRLRTSPSMANDNLSGSR